MNVHFIRTLYCIRILKILFLFQIEIEDSGLNVTGNNLVFNRLYNLRKLSLDTVTFRGIELIYTDRKFDFEHKSVNCNHNGIDNDCQIIDRDGNSGRNSKIITSGLITFALFFQIHFF